MADSITRYYFAARYSRNPELREYRANANVIVSFTGNGGGGKGGRHIEHGLALAFTDNGPWFSPGVDRIRIVIVGPRENIFHCHPATEVYASWAEFLAAELERES